MIVLLGAALLLASLGMLIVGLRANHHGVVWSAIFMFCISIWFVVGGLAVSAAKIL